MQLVTKGNCRLKMLALQVLLSLFLYLIVVFFCNMLEELTPIYASAPTRQGGLGLPLSLLAWPLTVSGGVLVVFTLYGYPSLQVSFLPLTLSHFWKSSRHSWSRLLLLNVKRSEAQRHADRYIPIRRSCPAWMSECGICIPCSVGRACFPPMLHVHRLASLPA